MHRTHKLLVLYFTISLSGFSCAQEVKNIADGFDKDYQFAYPLSWEIVADPYLPECRMLYVNKELAKTGNPDKSEFSICKHSHINPNHLEEVGFRIENGHWLAIGASGNASDISEAVKFPKQGFGICRQNRKLFLKVQMKILSQDVMRFLTKKLLRRLIVIINDCR